MSMLSRRRKTWMVLDNGCVDKVGRLERSSEARNKAFIYLGK
jgi:hypothetical protein